VYLCALAAGDDRGTQVMDTRDGPLNIANAGDAGDVRTVMQGSYPAEVSHTADGGRSSARQLIADKMQPSNPVAVNNPPIVNIAGGAAFADQVPEPAAASKTGS